MGIPSNRKSAAVTNTTGVCADNTEAGLTLYDVYGTKRIAAWHPVRTKSLPVPLGESPIYVVGPKGLKATPRPDPGK
jgi:hypothetical protein